MNCRFGSTAIDIWKRLDRDNENRVTSRDYSCSKSWNSTMISSSVRSGKWTQKRERKRERKSKENRGGWGDGSKLRWAWPIDRNHRSRRSDTDEALRVPDASVAAWKEIMADSRGQIRWTDTSHHLELVRWTREAFAFSRIGGFRLCIRLPCCSHREDPCPLSLSSSFSFSSRLS